MREIIIELESENELIPILKGKVFHVTPTINFPLIEKSGAIIPNQNNEWRSLFGNSINGFFRLRGCVSLFDYRAYGTEDWEEHAYKCTPTQIFAQTDIISILVLSKDHYAKLESWINWKLEEKWSQRVVPHVEVGYPGKVKVEYLTEHLIVKLKNS
ncbi:MAG: hypothetical protein N0C88_04565 [Candidatus Thiodiazotropha lotti]|uniref:Uncharacterized protein n=1 Tax=Candidatus Thiodiazotropha lotti TaxID=2792787 RepID=A0A9E4MYW0_9GAMM|nr:hypothetical protein [Candidatus Thiodiazotropha lotti]MCW4202583.1 hypothetical protein [Candidatus Thiodiazotropha lotti]